MPANNGWKSPGDLWRCAECGWEGPHSEVVKEGGGNFCPHHHEAFPRNDGGWRRGAFEEVWYRNRGWWPTTPHEAVSQETQLEFFPTKDK